MTRGENGQDSPPVVLITGAGRRLGNSIAQRLAGEHYRVILHVHRSQAPAQATADEIRAAGGEAAVVSADLADSRALAAMIEEAWSKFGRIDALVNCAAIWSPKPLEEVTPADVEQYFRVNTLATFLCCQQVGLRMAAQPTGGAIVNFGDWAVVRPYTDYAAYFPSKGAIPTLTRMFAVELASRNPRVRVNTVLPGPVMLPDTLSPAEQQEVIDATLVKRPGTGDDIAHAVSFLLENTFVTGVCLPVDGGRSVAGGGGKENDEG